MKTFVQDGGILTVAAPSAVAAGAGVLVGNIFGVAAVDAAGGADLQLATKGVFDLAKVAAQAWTLGDPVYWDAAARICTATATGNARIGTAVAAAANPSAAGRVRLEGSTGIPAVSDVHTLTFAAAAGGSNVAEVTIAAKDAAGNTVAGVFNFDLWLSDAATGAGLTGTTASGAVTAKAASGTDLGALTAKKMLRAQTKVDGTFILSITDTARTGFHVAALVPGTMRTVVSPQLVTGNYG